MASAAGDRAVAHVCAPMQPLCSTLDASELVAIRAWLEDHVAQHRAPRHTTSLPAARDGGRKNVNVSTRLSVQTHIGEGGYGDVFLALDHAAGDAQPQMVAVKRMREVFYSPSHALACLREIAMLRHFARHPNIVPLRFIDAPADPMKLNDVHIVMERMQCDLHRRLYYYKPLTQAEIKRLAYQLCCAVYTLHRAGVMHRDLKPANLLIDGDGNLRVADFGLARPVRDGLHGGDDDGVAEELTDMRFTRWYRPPEVLLGNRRYTRAADVWSVGCILGELFNRAPLFPSDDERAGQLHMVLQFTGRPTPAMLGPYIDQGRREVVRACPIDTRQPLHSVMRNAAGAVPCDAADLIGRMLQLDPRDRTSIEDALRHPYFADVLDEADLITLPPFDDSYERIVCAPGAELLAVRRAQLLDHMAAYHPHLLDEVYLRSFVHLEFAEQPANLLECPSFVAKYGAYVSPVPVAACAVAQPAAQHALVDPALVAAVAAAAAAAAAAPAACAHTIVASPCHARAAPFTPTFDAHGGDSAGPSDAPAVDAVAAMHGPSPSVYAERMDISGE